MGNLRSFKKINFFLAFLILIGSMESFGADQAAAAQVSKPLMISPSICLTTLPDLQQKKDACMAAQADAGNNCNQDSSSKIAEINQMMGMATQSISAMTGANQICGKLNSVLGLANIGLTAYSQICSLKKRKCDTSCATAQKTFEAAIATCKSQIAAMETAGAANALQISAMNFTQNDLIREATSVEQGYISSKIASCQGYTADLAMAALSTAANLMALKQANKCDDATTAGLTPPGAIDCSKPENAQLPKCICEKDPRIAGCSGLAGVGSGTTPSLNPVTLDPATSNIDANVDDLLTDDNIIPPVAGKPGETGAPPPNGGGSGLLSGASGGPAGDKNGKGGKGTGLDTNILGGVGGGGGGGGSRGSANSAMRAYMPGGKKDPTRGLAGKLNIPISSQVTRESGMSNFEKVKRTYNVTRGTLLPN